MLSFREAQAFAEEIKKRGSILGLDAMRALMEELNNPQEEIPVIHITGTNGKGSFGAYFASIGKAAGLRVGRYCSPAVFDPLECWQYDGRNISEDEYAQAMSQVKDACDILASRGIHPTIFEAETALAFVYFKRLRPDVLLLEVGMGGETDATNVICHPLACAFTRISRDHMKFLGETIEEIASVKAKILKPGCVAVSEPQEPGVAAVLQENCKKICGSQMNVISDADIRLCDLSPKEMTFAYRGKTYCTRMTGLYQMYNAALAMEVFRQLRGRLCPTLGDEEIEKAIAAGVEEAVWRGRYEVLGEEPLLILDGAHNEEAATVLAQTLENHFTNPSLTYIIGVLADKEHRKILSALLPYAKAVYTITPNNSRGMDGRLLLQEVKEVAEGVTHLEEARFCLTMEEALAMAEMTAARFGTPILAFGSLSYLGELREAYFRRKQE